MVTEIDNALFLSNKEISFQGRNDEPVKYRQIKFLDEKNDLVSATLGKDQDGEYISTPTEERTECSIKLEVEERDDKLRKRVIDIDW
jgi:hypothetical protein